MNLFSGAYKGRRVLVTGHTGFKGSWLALWLRELGAEVIGMALPPEAHPNHWDLLNLPVDSHELDIREFRVIKEAFEVIKPEIVFHLAAQPLVRRSYQDPLETWSTNVMGTANVLEVCRVTPSVRAIVVVTTDKCYENREWPWGYRENDRIGGHDPYSSSKAAAELVVASYRNSFLNGSCAPLLATARAGNVIGGGDWSEDRLLPDLIRALEKGRSLEIRSPLATRPWQHVLESLSGYLLLGQKLLMGDKSFAEPWNFGPELEGNRTVTDVLSKLSEEWPTLSWHATDFSQLHEATLLYLDSTKAQSRLDWRPVWNLNETINKTAVWYRDWLESGQIKSREQLSEYVKCARLAGMQWACS